MATISSLLGFTYIKANSFLPNRMAELKSLMLSSSKKAGKSSILKKFPHVLPETNFILKASAKGFALCTKAFIENGQFILEYKGEYTTSSFQSILNSYTVESCQGLRIDAYEFGSLGRFVNHSHTPNCAIKFFFFNGLLRAFLIAQEDIEADVELTYSYGFEIPFRGRNKNCLCGTDKICKKMFAKRNPPPNFVCRECGLVTLSKSKLQLHKMIHNDERPHTCTHCSRSFRRKYHLNRHFKAKHEGLLHRVQCATCQKHFSSSQSLKEHTLRKH